MRLGRVTGTVVSTVKHASLKGFKLLYVQIIDPQGQDLDDPVIALDRVQAGVGDRVLLVEEGGSARQSLNIPGEAPVRCAIVGIVDHVELAADSASV